MISDLTDVRGVLRDAEAFLVTRGVPNAKRNAEWILAHVLACHTTELYLTPAKLIDRRELSDFESLLQRRGSREPLQYILGSTEFMSLPFNSRPGVFIPRPDTEVLVEKTESLVATIWARSGSAAGVNAHPTTILDLCCGSGAIGVSLICRLPNASAVAVDIDGGAVNLTQENAVLNRVGDRIHCVQSDAIEFLRTESSGYDVVVCNPPYVCTKEIEGLPPEIRQHEPVLSLDGGDDGLDFYRAVVPLLHGVVTKGGVLAFEIGDTQGSEVKQMVIDAHFTDVEIHTDYKDLNRIVTAVKP